MILGEKKEYDEGSTKRRYRRNLVTHKHPKNSALRRETSPKLDLPSKIMAAKKYLEQLQRKRDNDAGYDSSDFDSDDELPSPTWKNKSPKRKSPPMTAKRNPTPESIRMTPPRAAKKLKTNIYSCDSDSDSLPELPGPRPGRGIVLSPNSANRLLTAKQGRQLHNKKVKKPKGNLKNDCDFDDKDYERPIKSLLEEKVSYITKIIVSKY